MTQIVIACIHSTDELLVVRRDVEDAPWRMPRLIFTADTVVDADLVAGTARKHFGLEAGCAYWKFSKPVSLPSREHGRTKALLFSASVPTGILEYVFPACGPHVVRLLAFRGIAQVLAPKEAFLVQPQLPL